MSSPRIVCHVTIDMQADVMIVLRPQVLDVTGNALWMDGGNRITSVEGLLTVFDKYENKLGGFYCPGHSGGVVKEWTHPDEVRLRFKFKRKLLGFFY